MGWEWFLSDPTARPVVEGLGRTGPRFFSAALGVKWTPKTGPLGMLN
jgi:hypothetical protein